MDWFGPFGDASLTCKWKYDSERVQVCCLVKVIVNREKKIHPLRASRVLPSSLRIVASILQSIRRCRHLEQGGPLRCPERIRVCPAECIAAVLSGSPWYTIAHAPTTVRSGVFSDLTHALWNPSAHAGEALRGKLVCLYVCFVASQRTLNQLRLQQYTTKVYVGSKLPFSPPCPAL